MDNLDEIEELFECRIDERHAGGYSYFCKKCHKECNVGEAKFKCRNGKIIPLYIFCRYGCGTKWKLEICLPENSGDLLH